MEEVGGDGVVKAARESDATYQSCQSISYQCRAEAAEPVPYHAAVAVLL